MRRIGEFILWVISHWIYSCIIDRDGLGGLKLVVRIAGTDGARVRKARPLLRRGSCHWRIEFALGEELSVSCNDQDLTPSLHQPSSSNSLSVCTDEVPGISTRRTYD